MIPIFTLCYSQNVVSKQEQSNRRVYVKLLNLCMTLSASVVDFVPEVPHEEEMSAFLCAISAKLFIFYVKGV